MKEAAASEQIEEIIKLLTRSAIPPLYQEELLNHLDRLDTEQAKAIVDSLWQLDQKEILYANQAAKWICAWQEIAERIGARLEFEAGRMEGVLVEELTSSSSFKKAV